MLIYIFSILLMIAADQAVKYWAYTTLQAQGSIPLVDGVFHLTYVENRGAAFSLFAQFDSRWFFVLLAAVISVVILIVLQRKQMQTVLGRWSLVLIAAGALGNAIDRMLRGFVVDLFDFRLIHFPVFNVADIFICVGGLLFFLYVMFQHKDAAQQTDLALEADGELNDHE